MNLFAVVLFICSFIVSNAQPADWVKKINRYDWLYSSVPQSGGLSPGLGNGYIGTTVFSDSVYVAGVYNGRIKGKYESSHRARVPSTINVKVITVDDVPVKFIDCTLDMEAGRYIERINQVVERTIYVNREYKNLIVHEVRSLKGVHEVCLNSNPGGSSQDINFTKVSRGNEYSVYAGWTQITEWDSDPKLYVVMATWEPNPSSTTKPGEVSSWSKCITVDSNKDPVAFYTVLGDNMTINEAIEKYKRFVQSNATLIQNSHVENWLQLRRNSSKMIINGYPELARVLNSTIYELFLSMRDDVYWSSSPGGITTNSYNGHVFWDYETWMYPVLLVMHPGFAEAGLRYRLNHLPGARKKARDNKYKGAMWPWESSYSGDEMTPTFANTGKMEHHISGDVVFAARQYDYLHRNSETRKNLLCPLALETAEYWSSRVEYGNDKKYHIRHIIPPDEYAENVDDNIYTNDVAKISLLYANECKKNDTWVKIANNMYLEYDEKLNYHPEFTGYQIGRVIKQADVILASFPLGQNYSTSSMLNDLFIYEKVTDMNGPAMTWSMHFINYIELATKEKEIVKATRKYFYKSFLLNTKGPFHVWWETPRGGVIHFATGAGGFAQSLIFGYAGLRIHYDPNHPEILARLKPIVPQDLIKSIDIIDINLLEGKVKIDVRVSQKGTFARSKNNGIYLYNEKVGKFILSPNNWTEIPSNIGLKDKNGYYIMMNKNVEI